MIKLRTAPLALLVLAGMFGGIGISAAFGLWKTENTKQPAKIREGDFAGMPSPSDIRGSYTWDEVSKAFGLPVDRLLSAFGSSSGSDKVNSLEGRYAGKLPAGTEIGTDSVRLFVSLYTGLPHEPESDTILPDAAFPILRAEGRAERTAIEAAAARAPSAPAAPAAAKPSSGGAAQAPAAAEAAAKPEPAAAQPKAEAPAASAAAPAEHAPTPGAITGKTSFGDLESWGYDMAKVEALLGGRGPAAQAIKDYCAAKGLSFSELKAKLQELAPR